MASPYKLWRRAILGLSPEGKHTLSLIKAYNGYQPRHEEHSPVNWSCPGTLIGPPQLAPAGNRTLTSWVGDQHSNHSAAKLAKSLGQDPN